MSRLRVALIGFGAIGAEVYARARAFPELEISHVVVRAARVAETRQSVSETTVVVSQVSDIGGPVDVALEVAGHSALESHGLQALARGIDLCVASVGALAQDDLRLRLIDTATAHAARLEILPGAIGGIDALAAAAQDGLTDVSYIGRKPPAAWRGSPADGLFDLDTITRETVLFEGTAREAALSYPKNANVVATVALAGLGLDATRVQLLADPAARGNTHKIAATGPLVALDYVTGGKPLPSNPRTSALTALSALRTLRNRAGPVSL
ncbi:MAG: aspartate dehydrogenase [Roseobacter sp.]